MCTTRCLGPVESYPCYVHGQPQLPQEMTILCIKYCFLSCSGSWGWPTRDLNKKTIGKGAKKCKKRWYHGTRKRLINVLRHCDVIKRGVLNYTEIFWKKNRISASHTRTISCHVPGPNNKLNVATIMYFLRGGKRTSTSFYQMVI